MSDNISSSEDDSTKLYESLDKEFLTDDLYNSSKKVEVENEEEASKLLPSLRNQNHEKVSINPFSIKVTPEFQKHVSKHLDKILDELIHWKKLSCKKRKIKTNQGGIKLLRNSKNLLQTSNIICIKTKRYEKNYDEKEIEERAKKVAVTPDWVLGKAETKHWAPSTKGEIEIIKINGKLKKNVEI